VQAGVWHFGQDTGTGKAMATKLMRAAVVPPRLLFLTARQPLDAYVAKDAHSAHLVALGAARMALLLRLPAVTGRTSGCAVAAPGVRNLAASSRRLYGGRPVHER